MSKLLLIPATCLLLALPLQATAGKKTEKADLACVDAEKPAEPFSEHDKWGMERYEAELARYKRDHERYLRCLDQKEKASPNSLGRKLDDAMAHPAQMPPAAPQLHSPTEPQPR